MTLSSSEAEYVAISEVCAEIMFLKQILEFLKIQVTLPIIVRADNVGAIYLAHNAVSGPRMKHVDIRYHFVRDYIEEGVIKTLRVRVPRRQMLDGRNAVALRGSDDYSRVVLPPKRYQRRTKNT